MESHQTRVQPGRQNVINQTDIADHNRIRGVSAGDGTTDGIEQGVDWMETIEVINILR